MALGKRRRERQLEAFVVASDLLKSPRPSVLHGTESASGGERLLRTGRKTLCPLLRRDDGQAWRAARRLLPDALRRLHRRPEVAPIDLLALHRQPIAR